MSKNYPPGWMGKTHAMWTRRRAATGTGFCLPTPMCSSSPTRCAAQCAYAEAEKADHLVLAAPHDHEASRRKDDDGLFQTLFIFGHRPWKIADPKARDHIGVGAFNLVRRSTYDAIGTYKALKMEVLDDMKLGKVIKNAGFAARVVFGEDLISLRWANGAFGIVNNFTKNFFALLSFQWWRPLGSV